MRSSPWGDNKSGPINGPFLLRQQSIYRTLGRERLSGVARNNLVCVRLHEFLSGLAHNIKRRDTKGL